MEIRRSLEIMSDRDSGGGTGEWVETVEPSSGKRIFANLVTGDCRWSPPSGAVVRKCSDESNHWWELFDKKTRKFYYYNVASRVTDWHRPLTGDVIPLAELQKLRQNTEEPDALMVVDREMTPSEPAMKSSHRRTASARINRELQGSAGQQMSRARFSQRVSRGERLAKASASVLRNDNHCQTTVDIAESEPSSSKPSGRVLQKQSLSFDKGKEQDVSSAMNREMQESLLNCPDVVRSSKLQPSNRDHALIDVHSNLDTSCFQQMPEKLQLPHSASQNASQRHERSRRPRTENASLDSGITPDVACTSAEVQSFMNSSPEDQRFYPFAQHPSNFEHISERGRQTVDEAEQCKDMSSVPAPQMTPGSQRRAFPRTNPKFMGSGTASFKKTNTSTSQKQVNELLQPINALQCHENETDTLPSQQLEHGMAIDGHMAHKTNNEHNKTDKLAESKSNVASKKNPEPATYQTLFLYHKVSPDPEDPWHFFDSNDKFHSIDSALSFSSIEGESGHTIPSNARKDVLGDERPSAVPVQDQTSVQRNFTDRTEFGERRRTRHNSEPDYANVQEVAKMQSHRDIEHELKKDQEDLNFKAKNLRAKAEPIYANELLTGRGCLTHEDRFHIPLHQGGHHDNSFGSSGSSTISTSSPKLIRASRNNNSSNVVTRHMSLRHKRGASHSAASGRNFIDKTSSMRMELSQQRPMSAAAAAGSSFGSDSDAIVCQVAETLTLRAGLEQYLAENLNEQRKGLLGKAVPINNMLNWTKDALQKPMIRTDNKTVKKEAPEVFKMIQTYMGDRKSRDSSTDLVVELVNKGWSIKELRDEIYIQLCRQTTKNTRDESLLCGWELMGICLSFFPPSAKFQLYLEGHICQALETPDHSEGLKLHGYAQSCLRRLEKTCHPGTTRKPTVEEVERCRKCLLEPSMFGNTLEDIMVLQKDKHPDYHIPWIQVTLSDALLNFKGNRLTEGIFRVPGDVDEVNALRARCDQWEKPSSRTDPHVLASVLKLWYRELDEPLIPDEFYDDCVNNFDNPNGAIAVVSRLPHLNMLVLNYLIQFLQKFAKYSSITKMDASNLAMVMAPNVLRCPASNPQLLLENARKEMSFIRTLIQNLDI